MPVLGFEVEWYDPIACDVKPMYLKFWTEDNTVELLKNGPSKSTFLKKIHYPSVTERDLFIGSSITIFDRVIVLTNYANSATRDYMMAREVHFLVVIPASQVGHAGSVLQAAKEHRLSIARVRTAGSSVPDYLDGGDVVLELVGIAGQNGEDFAADISRISSEITAVDVPMDEITAYMDKCTPCTAHSNATLCLIKPHVIKSGDAGACLDAIYKAGFQVEAMFAIHMSLTIAEPLFEVYRGIFTSYSKTLAEICSGPVLALMVVGPENVVESFRSFCGPLEPELARTIRPDTLRARFGVDTVHNAVHCTDLCDDGEMETKYLFETLASL